MATVEGKTSIKIDELVNGTVISGYVNSTTGQLVLVTRGGSEILAGSTRDPLSMPIIVLPPGSDVSDVPVGTPVPCIVLIEGA